jgi:hypothetical protein
MDVHGFVIGKARILNETNPALWRVLIRGTIAAIEVSARCNVNRLADELIRLHRPHGSGVVCAEEKQQDEESVPQGPSTVLNVHGTSSSARQFDLEPASTQRSGRSLFLYIEKNATRFAGVARFVRANSKRFLIVGSGLPITSGQ